MRICLPLACLLAHAVDYMADAEHRRWGHFARGAFRVGEYAVPLPAEHSEHSEHAQVVPGARSAQARDDAAVLRLAAIPAKAFGLLIDDPFPAGVAAPLC